MKSKKWTVKDRIQKTDPTTLRGRLYYFRLINNILERPEIKRLPFWARIQYRLYTLKFLIKPIPTDDLDN